MAHDLIIGVDAPGASGTTLRTVHRQQMLHTLPFLGLGLGALYAFYAVLFLRASTPHHVANAAWTAATAGCLVVVGGLALRRSIRLGVAEWVAVAVGLLIVYDGTAYIVQSHDPTESFNVILTVIGASVVYPTVLSYGAIVGLAIAGWCYARIAVDSPQWGHLGFYLLSGLVVSVALFLSRRTTTRRLEHARAQLRRMAVVDELTGLHNRRGFYVLAEQAMLDAERTGAGFTLLFVDVDGLKQINDLVGHSAGDAALQETASLLRATFRGADVVARLGGDEFCALLPEAQPGVSYHDRLGSVVIEANARAGRDYLLSLSVGEARYDPQRPVPLEELLAASDQAMYADKLTRRR